MSTSGLRLVWVYPDLLSTYGDQGNVLVVERRARQRGLPVSRVDVRSDQPLPTSGDIYLIGGGTYPLWRVLAPEHAVDPVWIWWGLGGLFVAAGAVAISRREAQPTPLLYLPLWVLMPADPRAA